MTNFSLPGSYSRICTVRNLVSSHETLFSKRVIIRPHSCKTWVGVFQQQVAHSQQRSYSIHAGSFSHTPKLRK